jgi:cell division protein ZapA (FtsZ GTPase activity inhibitor)
MADARGKSAVTVTIGGEEHVIRASVEPEYTIRCARWVDDRITEIRRHVGLIESHKVAILAALSIADDLFRLQGEVEAMQERSGRQVAELARALEEVLVPAGATGGGEPAPAAGEAVQQTQLL